MAAHRYWRLYVTAVQSGSEVSLTKVQLRDANQVEQTGFGTASASSTGEGSPASAFDSSYTSRWNSNLSGLPQWIKYDFGAGNAKDISTLGLSGRLDSFASSQSPRDFSLQYSDDDSSWTTLFSVSGVTSWGTWGGTKYFDSTGQIDPPPPGAGTSSKQVWRVKATAIEGGSAFSIDEITMRTSIGGPDQTTGGTPRAGYTTEGTTIEAFDGSVGYWQGGSAFPEWIGYDFGSPKDIVEIAIKARSLFFNQSPKEFSIDYWDVDHWQTVHTVTDATGWGSGEVRTYTFGPNSSVVRTFVWFCT